MDRSNDNDCFMTLEYVFGTFAKIIWSIEQNYIYKNHQSQLHTIRVHCIMEYDKNSHQRQLKSVIEHVSIKIKQ